MRQRRRLPAEDRFHAARCFRPSRPRARPPPPPPPPPPPRHKGFFYSHVGWIFAKRHSKTDLVKIADFARFPELMWLHRLELAPAIALGVLCWLVAGWSGLVVGFFW